MASPHVSAQLAKAVAKEAQKRASTAYERALAESLSHLAEAVQGMIEDLNDTANAVYHLHKDDD